MGNDNKISQPHDKYAKSILSRVEEAKSLIQSRFPQELVKRIDMNSLQLTNKSFVSEEMKAFHSDVIYKCNIDNNQGYIYYEIEHVRHESTHIKSIYHMARLYPNLRSHYLGAPLATMGC